MERKTGQEMLRSKKFILSPWVKGAISPGLRIDLSPQCVECVITSKKYYNNSKQPTLRFGHIYFDKKTDHKY